MRNIDLLGTLFEPQRPLLINLPSLQGLLSAVAGEVTPGRRASAKWRGQILTPSGAGKSYPRQAEDWNGKTEMPGMTVTGSVAEIPIYGLIADKIDPFAKWYFDATDLRDVNREIDRVEGDKSISQVRFLIDSPGGSSRNVPETSERIEGLRKSKLAFVDGIAASAAIWMASCAGPVFSTKGSVLGSIGAYATFYDLTSLFDKIGIEAQVFSSGKFKGAGVPGTSLTKEQSSEIQSEVDQISNQFKEDMRRTRGGRIPESAMEGQTFTGPLAVSMGMADGIRRSVSDAAFLY